MIKTRDAAACGASPGTAEPGEEAIDTHRRTLCLTQIGNLENGVFCKIMACLFAARIVVWRTAHARVSAPPRCITVFSFTGVNGARVGAWQPVLHVACHRRAHACCVTQEAISRFDYRGADGGDDAPGLDWYSSQRKPVRLSFFWGMGVPMCVVVVGSACSRCVWSAK